MDLVNQVLMPMTPQFSVGNPEIFKFIINGVCPNFEVDEYNKHILNKIYLYCHGIGDLDPKKGIFLWGDIGTGKSTLLKIIAEYQRTMGRGYKRLNCSALSTNFMSEGYTALIESTENKTSGRNNPVERGFDELGREPRPVKYFGVDLDVMQYILQIRYEIKAKTHIATNLKPDAIDILYGKYIADRAIEMFNFIKLEGKSRRK